MECDQSTFKKMGRIRKDSKIKFGDSVIQIKQITKITFYVRNECSQLTLICFEVSPPNKLSYCSTRFDALR